MLGYKYRPAPELIVTQESTLIEYSTYKELIITTYQVVKAMKQRYSIFIDTPNLKSVEYVSWFFAESLGHE